MGVCSMYVSVKGVGGCMQHVCVCERGRWVYAAYGREEEWSEKILLFCVFLMLKKGCCIVFHHL